ncbi:MAG: biopolymer transporter ExbD [Nitrospina sp.]|nr:biopolymer transporter ExbD [Nitrospina sp.]MBT6296950.1 biopolymer transporter ExbD [Nitrospina sp.]
MIKFQKTERDTFSLDLVPMINIVFLLLIFFMLTSTAMKSVLGVDLPEASSSTEISGKNLVIKINKDGVLELGDQVINSELLSEQLKDKFSLNENEIVEIHADKNIQFELFSNIIALARQAGAKEFIFATENTDGP